MSHPHTHHNHAHPADHGHEHVHDSAARAHGGAASWLLRSAAWRVGMAGFACALVLAVAAWAMTVQG